MNFDTSAKKSFISPELRADESFGVAGFRGNEGLKRFCTLDVTIPCDGADRISYRLITLDVSC